MKKVGSGGRGREGGVIIQWGRQTLFISELLVQRSVNFGPVKIVLQHSQVMSGTGRHAKTPTPTYGTHTSCGERCPYTNPHRENTDKHTQTSPGKIDAHAQNIFLQVTREDTDRHVCQSGIVCTEIQE